MHGLLLLPPIRRPPGRRPRSRPLAGHLAPTLPSRPSGAPRRERPSAPARPRAQPPDAPARQPPQAPADAAASSASGESTSPALPPLELAAYRLAVHAALRPESPRLRTLTQHWSGLHRLSLTGPPATPAGMREATAGSTPPVLAAALDELLLAAARRAPWPVHGHGARAPIELELRVDADPASERFPPDTAPD